MTIYLLALLMGVVAGVRAMAAPAMVCWAVYLSGAVIGAAGGTLVAGFVAGMVGAVIGTLVRAGHVLRSRCLHCIAGALLIGIALR